MLYDILNQLAETTGTNDKLKILQQYEGISELREYLKLAIDERVRFNVNKLPVYELNPNNPGLTWISFSSMCILLWNKDITGHAAIAFIENTLKQCTEKQHEWLRLCLQKDTSRLGVGRKLVNKVWPGLVLDFKCSLASPEDEIEKFDWSNGAVCELKLNGVRTLIVMRNGKCEEVYGRSGLPIDNFRFFADVIEEVCKSDLFPQNFVLDGEVHVNNSLEDTMSLFGFDLTKTEDDFTGKNGKVGSGWKVYQERKAEILKFQQDAVYCIFDYLEIDEWDSQTGRVLYTDRYVKVEGFMHDMAALDLDCYFDVPERSEVDDVFEAIAVSKSFIFQGLEGGILKSKNHLYSFKRDRNWIKIKEEVETDVQILGFEISKEKYNSDGTAKPDMLGKFLVRDQGGREYSIGTGKYLSEEKRVEIWNNQSEYLNKIFYATAQRFTDTAAICPRIEYERIDKTEL
jgi:ATP-dependent DNA ligase